MMDFGEFATFLGRAAAATEPRLEVALAKIGEHTLVMAVEYIGHQMPEWAPLSQATLHGFVHPYGFRIAGKIELGYTGHVSATDPLLRKGTLRNSYSVSVIGLTQTVGSPLKEALWQEMGTVNHLTGNIPPRPVSGLAARHSLPYSMDVLGEAAVKLLTPGMKP